MFGKIYSNYSLLSVKYLGLLLTFLSLFLIDIKASEGRDSADIDNLIEIIESKGVDWKIQISAIKELSESSNPRGLEILLRLINDPFLNYDCPALKLQAAEALGRYRHDSRIVETLIRVASDKDNPNHVREAAINSLGEIGDRRALDLLVDMLGSRSFALRMSAIKAIGRIGDPAAIPYLELLLEKDTDLRTEVRIVLNSLRANGNKKWP